MKKRKSGNGFLAISFGVGLLLACICPSGWLVAILAALLIIMGILCIK